MRDLFTEARKRAPAIIFIDEIDAIGQRRSGTGAIVSDDDRELVAALSEHADPVAKITILPAGQTLGVTEQLPLDERHLYSEDYLTDSFAVRLGGRATELLEFGQGSTGAANDLADATDLAIKMVRDFGLSPAFGPAGYPGGGSVFLGGGGGQGLSSRPFAEATQALVDSEVARLVREAEQASVELIRSHRTELEQLVDLLLEQETVDGSAVYRIGDKPVPGHWSVQLAIAPHTRAAAAVAPDGESSRGHSSLRHR